MGALAIFEAQILRLTCLRQASAWQARRHYSWARSAKNAGIIADNLTRFVEIASDLKQSQV